MKRYRTEPKTVRRDKFSVGLTRDAQALFSERLGRPVSEGEARNLLGNLTDFMWMLIFWKTHETDEAPPAPPSEPVKKAPKSKGPRRPNSNPKSNASRTK